MLEYGDERSRYILEIAQLEGRISPDIAMETLKSYIKNSSDGSMVPFFGK